MIMMLDLSLIYFIASGGKKTLWTLGNLKLSRLEMEYILSKYNKKIEPNKFKVTNEKSNEK